MLVCYVVLDYMFNSVLDIMISAVRSIVDIILIFNIILIFLIWVWLSWWIIRQMVVNTYWFELARYIAPSDIGVGADSTSSFSSRWMSSSLNVSQVRTRAHDVVRFPPPQVHARALHHELQTGEVTCFDPDLGPDVCYDFDLVINVLYLTKLQSGGFVCFGPNLGPVHA